MLEISRFVLGSLRVTAWNEADQSMRIAKIVNSFKNSLFCEKVVNLQHILSINQIHYRYRIDEHQILTYNR